ncbi:hypothetical protein KP509_33G032300 [Ceratopteris richardii]|uniref:Phytocyanin domain-containing protein n=1 Tax=Ceratopteris richardii TaxID=49495 RepID=A0A8T2QQA1_CERRI|nr:hypothetical protein KP509_33G032300 [Ceratopteris richardii]
MAASPPMLVMVVLVATMQLSGRGSAKQYNVGDSSGWTEGVDYESWASNYTFYTGDSLRFNSMGGLHTVQQVSADDFRACSSKKAIMSGTSATNVVKLDKAQTYYFICGEHGHCQAGMQLRVTVTDGSPSKSAPASENVAINETNPSATATPTTPSISSPLTPSITPNGSSSRSQSSSIPCPLFSVFIVSSFLVVHALVEISWF